ncbi:MAG: HAMP domain-containing sensor histidine kinase [Alphaproteobacteria bacterium]
MTFRRGHIPWLIASAVVLIGTSFVALIIMTQHTSRLQDFLAHSYWAAAQTESEFLRLQNSLVMYVADAPGATHEDVRLKLDILFSRIDVVVSGNTSDVAGGYDRTAAFVAELSEAAHRVDMLTEDPSFRDGPAAQEAIEILQSQWIPLHSWVREILHGRLWLNDREAIVQQQEAIILVNSALALLSIAIVIGIFRQNRRFRAMARREARARANAEHAAASRDRFVAGMSHELRTPLNAINGFCEMLSMGIYGKMNKKQAGYVENIAASGQHLLSLINDILDYSKLEARMYEPDMAKVDLKIVVAEAVRFIEPTFIERGGMVDVRCPDGPVWIYADRRISLQCAVNLLSNAAKFSPEDGRIEIDVVPAGHVTRLSIRDNGPGMSEADLESAFEPFKQAGDPFTATKGGTGLGLSITRSFCDVMGAKLTLKSSLGNGLAATIDFQSDAPKEQSDPVPASPRQAA